MIASLRFACLLVACLLALLLAAFAANPGRAAEAERVRLPSGIEIAYREAGSGPRAMILVHGWSMSSRMWERVLARPPAGFRLVAYDLRGFGGSSKTPDGYDYATLGRDLGELMDALRIERAVLAGHSLGSFLIQDFAAANPGRVEALVLTSPQPRSQALAISPPIQATIDAVAPDKDRRAFFAVNTPRYFAPGALSPGDLDLMLAVNMEASPEALQQSFRHAFTAPALDVAPFQTRPVPALAILGTADIVPLAALRQIAMDFPGSCAALVERAGHTSPWERPERWLGVVEGFLSAPGGARSC